MDRRGATSCRYSLRSAAPFFNAAGVSFPEQIRLTISVLGIADVYD